MIGACYLRPIMSKGFSMESSKMAHVSLTCRWLLGLLFIYHGLVPKILWLDETEIALINASGSLYPASLVSPLAGIGEIILGLIIIFSRSLIPIYVAGVSLIALLLVVAVIMPSLLGAAFNPVTTNVLGLGLCYLIWYSQPTPRK